MITMLNKIKKLLNEWAKEATRLEYDSILHLYKSPTNRDCQEAARIRRKIKEIQTIIDEL